MNAVEMDEETQDLSEFETDLSPPECIATIEVESLSSIQTEYLDLSLYAGEDFIVGRDCNKCQHAIPDERVSKQHFRIYSVIYEAKSTDLPPLVYCEDLESFNGTYVNDVLIGEIARERVGRLLCDGDLIEIRPFWKFRFYQPDHRCVFPSMTQEHDQRYFADRYEVSNRMLGKGQYGNVYLATEATTTKQLACKVIDLELAMKNLSLQSAGNASLQRWESGMRVAHQKKKILREIKILAKLSHPNVIDLKKAFCSHTALYIFSELSTGGDLYSYMQIRGGHLDDYNARFISRQVTLAIQYLHFNGIAHRDIKPENVLVSHTYFGGRVVLTDFGFAINIGSASRTARMMSKLGTEGYAAPEVEAMGNSSTGYTHAADLWSLGVLAACMLTGDTTIPRQVLSGLSLSDIEARYLGIDDQNAREAWLLIQPRALKFIRKLLIIDPEKRMTADEAICHPWFTKPRREAEALMEGIEKINVFWEKRNVNTEILEFFPGVDVMGSIGPEPEIPVQKFRKKVPDATLSPYFGLDRHLYQREEPTRKRILQDLMDSGSQFVASKEPPPKKTMSFGSGHLSSLDQELESFETFTKNFIALPKTPAEKIYGLDFSDPMDSSTSFSSRQHVTSQDSPKSAEITVEKRMRQALVEDDDTPAKSTKSTNIEKRRNTHLLYTSPEDLRDRMKGILLRR